DTIGRCSATHPDRCVPPVGDRNAEQAANVVGHGQGVAGRIENEPLGRTERARFDEPTLGAMRADGFYFVANSHWNRFDQENRLPDGLSGPIVLKLRASTD
ncbi:MAG: hypothetical protein P8X98_16300, partial [Woeseiaceae bacterium]